MKVLILVDTLTSWILPYAKELHAKVQKQFECSLIHSKEQITPSDVMFILGCEKIIEKKYLLLNKHNLVVHESDLPAGKGWSPLTWQILEGKNTIPICLFEADQKVDAGDIYIKDYIEFNGTELNVELKHKQGMKTIELCEKFLAAFPEVKAIKQEGQESFYPKRGPLDSQLDPDKTLIEQFNLLRVVDNERYPAFFFYHGKKYILKIFSSDLN